MRAEVLKPARRREPRWGPSAWIGAALFIVLVLLLLITPWLATKDPLVMELQDRLHAPSKTYLLGTDSFGRDVLSRTLYGGRRTMTIAGVALGITVIGGLILGMLAGFYGRKLDQWLMRLMDVLLAFPGLLLILVLVAMMGAGSRTLAIAVGLAGMPAFSRVVRSAVIVVRNELYVEAAQAVGCSDRRILLRHVLPNVLGAVVAFATVQFGWAILNASAMSFLGLGESPAVPEWGAMLNAGRGFLRDAPWASAAPGMAITLSVLSVNLLGDALQLLFQRSD